MINAIKVFLRKIKEFFRTKSHKEDVQGYVSFQLATQLLYQTNIYENINSQKMCSKESYYSNLLKQLILNKVIELYGCKCTSLTPHLMILIPFYELKSLTYTENDSLGFARWIDNKLTVTPENVVYRCLAVKYKDILSCIERMQNGESLIAPASNQTTPKVWHVDCGDVI